MTDIPDNLDWGWLARHLVGLREETRDLKSDLRHLREDIDVVAMRVIRIDTGLTALRDDLCQLFEMHRDLRGRIETIEKNQ